jgi:hypothetical protein
MVLSIRGQDGHLCNTTLIHNLILLFFLALLERKTVVATAPVTQPTSEARLEMMVTLIIG